MNGSQLRWTLVTLAALWAACPGAAYAQLGVDVGGTVGSTVDTVGGAVGGVTDTVTSAVGGVTGNSSGPDSGESTATPPTAVTLDQAAVLEAVNSARALPLAEILARAQLDGQVVDAQLIAVGAFLLYELKVLDADGDVTDVYFYARSGEPVQIN